MAISRLGPSGLQIVTTVPVAMHLELSISTGPLGAPGSDPALPRGPGTPACTLGAKLLFEGIIRQDEAGRRLTAIDYQTYEPMAQNQLRDIAEQLAREFPIAAMRIEHSRGVVPVGAVSFRLTIWSPHRAEALKAAERFINQMKQDVPIFKNPVFEP